MFDTPEIEQQFNKNVIELKDKEFKLIRDYIYSTIGINLSEHKKNLLSGRLQKLLRKYNLNSFHQYYEFVLSDKTGELLSELADNISTNHTYFYRESKHFEIFKNETIPKIIEEKKKKNSNDLRIWCAGSSTGEEPYTLEMILMDTLGINYKDYNAGLLASDISMKALGIAKKGIYHQDKLKQVPKDFIRKYFKKINENEYQVREIIKREVLYKRFNLMNKTFPFNKKFDVIFCRNVMIYFDDKTRDELLRKFWDCLEPHGTLFIGHSETISKKSELFKFHKPAMYLKVEN